MAITLKWRTINLKPKNIMATNPVQPMVAPLPTAQPQAPVASQPYTPWTSIDGRTVQTNTGNPYIAYSQRAKPTVATAQQPVISKTTNNSLIYDPNDPEDYLMKLQARGVTGKTPTEQEYYQALQAQKALQARQTNSANPLQSQMDELIRQQQEQRGLESGRDTNELDAYRKQLDQQYGVQRDELLASWDRQRSAAQNVYSFSWFGRSTAAANKMTEIQKWIDWSIESLNAAKEAAIAAKKAELEWADSETLSALNSRVQQYQDAANKRQMDSLQQTAQANQTSGASYIESLNNLMATASKNGMDIWNPEDIQIYAQMARNPDGSINEEFVGSLPEWMQAIIRTANIQQSKEAPKIENFGTTKSPRYMQRDGAKRAPVSWAGGWSMWGGWSGWVRSGGWNGWGWAIQQWWQVIEQTPSNLYDLSLTSKNKSKLSQTAVENLSAGKNDALNALDSVERLLDTWDYTSWPLWGLATYNPKATKTISANQKFGIAAQVVGKFLEWGKLAEWDIKRYKALLPDVSDTPEVAKNKLEQTKKLIIENYNWQLDSSARAWYNVSNFKYITPKQNNVVTPVVAAQQKPNATTWAGRWVKK